MNISNAHGFTIEGETNPNNPSTLHAFQIGKAATLQIIEKTQVLNCGELGSGLGEKMFGDNVVRLQLRGAGERLGEQSDSLQLESSIAAGWRAAWMKNDS